MTLFGVLCFVFALSNFVTVYCRPAGKFNYLKYCYSFLRKFLLGYINCLNTLKYYGKVYGRILVLRNTYSVELSVHPCVQHNCGIAAEKSSNKKLIVTFNDVMRFLFQVCGTVTACVFWCCYMRGSDDV